MTIECYQLGPLVLRVAAAEPDQQHLRASWQQLFRIQPLATPATDLPMLDLYFSPASQAPLPPAPRQLLAGFGASAIWQGDNDFQFTCGDTVITLAAGQAVGYLADDFWAYPVVEQRDFWQRVFFLLVRRLDCYFLHANALVAPDGTDAGVLFVGDCGSGKTTLTLGLLAAGWRYVTDDSVLLQLDGAGGVCAHAVRRGFACTAQTATQWPWLAPLFASGIALSRHKRLLDVDPLYPAHFLPWCRPRYLCFPRITDASHSQLTPLTPIQTFTTLLGQPRTGILVDPANAGVLLTLFKSLVHQTQGYQLALGQDVLTASPQVSQLLMQALQSSPLEVV